MNIENSETAQYKEQYDSGFDDGYAHAQELIIQDYEERLSELENIHKTSLDDIELENERNIEREVKTAISNTEDIFESKIRDIQYNISNIITEFQATIRKLKEDNYNLRKENATITRSV
jgi:flagellar biosynthesis/type III secretory pathway protein FliH